MTIRECKAHARPIRLAIGLLSSLSIWLSASPVQADTAITNLDSIRQHLTATLAGAASTIALHELGHFTAAKIESVHAEFDGATIVYPNQNLSKTQSLRLSTAGYQSQWLAAEYAFQRLKKPATDDQKAFHVGMILGHIGISLAYLTVLKGHQNGDSLGTAAASSLSEDQVLLALAIPAALDSWRLFGKHPPKWLPLVSRGSKAIGIAAVWSF